MTLHWWVHRYGRIGLGIMGGLVILGATWMLAGRSPAPLPEPGSALAAEPATDHQSVAVRGQLVPAVQGVPALTVERPLTMPVTLQLTVDEQQALRLVEWLPVTSTHTIAADPQLAQALMAAINAKRSTPLVLDPALTARAEQMALSKLTWRLYDESSRVWQSRREQWMRTFGVYPGGPLSLDMFGLPAEYRAASHNPEQLQALIADSALGVSQSWATHMGIGIAQVDGWDVGGTLVILFY